MQQTILVAGATGTVGNQIVKQLAEAGHHVRALTRNAAKAHFPAGVEVVEGDLTTPQSFAHAFEGATGLHLINFGGDDYAHLSSGPEIVDLAKRAGVKRITVLLGGEIGTVEAAVQASGLSWTFLQPVEFMGNLREWAESIRTSGTVTEAYANRRSAIVHEADIAAIGVAALTQEGHGGKTYVITGPETLTPIQMLDTIGKAIDRDLTYVELSEEEAIANWKAAGFDDDSIQFFRWIYGNTPEIGYTVVPTVQEVTGRPARSIAQWAAENANLFRS